MGSCFGKRIMLAPGVVRRKATYWRSVCEHDRAMAGMRQPFRDDANRRVLGRFGAGIMIPCATEAGAHRPWDSAADPEPERCP